MNLRRLIVVLFAALLPTTFAYCVQDVPPPEKVEEEQVEEGDFQIEDAEMGLPVAGMGDHFLQMQNQAVDGELGKLQSHLDFDDEWKAKAKAALKKEIEKSAKMADVDDMMAFSFSNSVEEKLQKKIMEFVAEDLPDEKREAFAKYQEIESQFRQP